MRPTLLLGRDHPQTQVYLALQPAAGTATAVANGTGGLLPHLFTLAGIPESMLRRLFSVTGTCPHGQLPFRKCGALRCPDFPLLPHSRSDGTTCCLSYTAEQIKSCLFHKLFYFGRDVFNFFVQCHF